MSVDKNGFLFVIGTYVCNNQVLFIFSIYVGKTFNHTFLTYSIFDGFPKQIALGQKLKYPSFVSFVYIPVRIGVSIYLYALLHLNFQEGRPNRHLVSVAVAWVLVANLTWNRPFLKKNTRFPSTKITFILMVQEFLQNNDFH